VKGKGAVGRVNWDVEEIVGVYDKIPVLIGFRDEFERKSLNTICGIGVSALLIPVLIYIGAVVDVNPNEL
jgi:hypothetical protein